MGTYAVTGSASGMGHEAAERLRRAGHSVIGVDLGDAEVIADLSTRPGREAAAAEVLSRCDGRLDGAVLAAGIGPRSGAGQCRSIFEINFFGAIELLDTWRPALATAGTAKVVVIGSNSATTTPLVPRRAVRALLAHDATKATRALRGFGPLAPPLAYAASKIALTRWVRRHAVAPQWADAGIRMNVLAPGAIDTPLLQKQLADPRTARAIRSFPVPTGGFGDPGHLADWMVFMMSDAAEFLCGSVIFVDGGTDACLRSDDWPRRYPTSRLPRYVRRVLAFRRRYSGRCSRQ
ncbi:SDR family oxidoreductase [Mycobacterium sp. B14F4]|uniref:SDR family oxidoreductase n=1 Tax=Mycobacterium sp. B14F4 TaxID=3153565 RepID=UPI00325CFFBE